MAFEEVAGVPAMEAAAQAVAPVLALCGNCRKATKTPSPADTPARDLLIA